MSDYDSFPPQPHDAPTDGPQDARADHTPEHMPDPSFEWRFERSHPLFDPHAEVSRWQRGMRRRLAALLCTGTLAFTLTTWILVQHERQAPALVAVSSGSRAEAAQTQPGGAGEPVQAARAQIEALNRGDIRAAYEMFSPHYREAVKFDAFKALVLSHRAMFRTEEEEVDPVGVTPDHVRIDLHLQSDDNEHYIAHYTMARIDGRWWVDDLRWVNADDENEGLNSA